MANLRRDLNRLKHTAKKTLWLERLRQTSRAQPMAKPVTREVDLYGYMSEHFGVAAAARYTASALAERGYSVRCYDVRNILAGEPGFAPEHDHRPRFQIYYCNPDELTFLLQKLDPTYLDQGYRIASWVYEFERAPTFWEKAADLVHEIWAPSTFVREALSNPAPHYRVVPYQVSVDEGASSQQDIDGFVKRPGDDFIVASAGDVRSSLTRKNLLGAVEIYKRAFPQADEGTRLLVKVTSSSGQPEEVARLEAARGGRADIHIFDRDFDRAQLSAFYRAISLFLSPHRSEGFGLMIAEAMLCGTPVLATGWSANMDFMAGLDEMIIPYRLTQSRDDSGVYRPEKGRMWAEPDIDTAAQKLRVLRSSKEMQTHLGERGRTAIQQMNAFWDDFEI